MSRIPKFRAWDRERKQLLPVVLLAYPWLEVSPSDDDDEGNECYELTYTTYEDGSGVVNCDLSESTGLKDKNGVEICEGDIVR